MWYSIDNMEYFNIKINKKKRFMIKIIKNC